MTYSKPNLKPKLRRKPVIIHQSFTSMSDTKIIDMNQAQVKDKHQEFLEPTLDNKCFDINKFVIIEEINKLKSELKQTINSK